MNLITILGPTASGKTKLATQLAATIGGEIISADSRQVYRGMNIGTGKDLNEYRVNNQTIPYHIIDIADAGYKYNVYEYQRDFVSAYNQIISQQKTPIVCGGTGLYIEAVLKGYKLVSVPENKILRDALANKSLEELSNMLHAYKKTHNQSDVDTAKRAIRAIEIADYYQHNLVNETDYPQLKSGIIGLDINREKRRERISARLKNRIDEGMIDEVQGLLNSGISANDLIYYGLEYKYLTLYCTKQLSFNDMFSQLEIAIHQFAKRQMTWFRGMERRGFTIHWIDALLPEEEKLKQVQNILNF